MTALRFLRASLQHYWKLHLPVLIGVALTSAILSGAFVVGDSVKESLRRNSDARLSRIGSAFLGGERFFTTGLSDRVQSAIQEGSIVAPVIQLNGTASSQEGGRRANKVQIVGVDERFWSLSHSQKVPDGFSDERFAAANSVLAERLGVKSGDTVIVRIEIPAALSKDAPLSGESEQTTPFTVVLSSILGTEDFGHYSLKPEQVPPATLFVRQDRLAAVAELAGRANLLLADQAVTAESLAQAVESRWSLDDVQVVVKKLEGDVFQLTGSRVFLDDGIVSAVEAISSESAPSLTYLATDVAREPSEKGTPYSIISSVAPRLNEIVPAGLAEDGIILSDWLAEDIGAKIGDRVRLSYDVVGMGRALVEEQKSFTVVSIQPLEHNGWDRSWTPEFPGIFDVDSLDDWEPGIPIDRSRIRPKDDDYWNRYRTTPKAFVSWAAAREMWANRFGSATALRFRPKAEVKVDSDGLAEAMRPHLRLADLGMSTRALRDEAAAAVSNSFDFGSLFASMSFFLIVAALILTGLVFVFGIEQRSSEIGLLLALGFSHRRIRRLFLSESSLLAVVGAGLGLLGGYVYTRLALHGMSGVWRDAAAGMEFVYFLNPQSLGIAFATTVCVALAVVWFASRRIFTIPPSALISGVGDEESFPAKKHRWDRVLVIVCLLGVLGCLFAPRQAGTIAEQGLFFGAGFFAAAWGVAVVSLWMGTVLRSRMHSSHSSLSSLEALGRRYAVRRRGRSLAVIGLMAAGVFVVTAINSFRLEGSRGAERRDSGTGGFAYVGESTLPIYEDLNGMEGRKKYGLDSLKEDFSVLSFRVSDGDDASCLNLNRAQSPRLMAVDVERIAAINPFHFVRTLGEIKEGESPWRLLSITDKMEDGRSVVPGVIDQNTAIYALGKNLGDIIRYQTVSGEVFNVRIVGFLDTSILQGCVLIDTTNYIRFFPDAGGFRFFLLDGGRTEALQAVAERMTRMFGDLGLEMRPAWAKLDEFNAVQNTYLSIFSTLGGLGLLLGTLGLAVVVGRNVAERRGQLGVMQAMGFTRQRLARMVLAEHWFLHLTGVLIGIVAAVIAVFPKLMGGVAALPWWLLIGINVAVLLGGLLFCMIAARTVLRGKLLDAIRRE